MDAQELLDKTKKALRSLLISAPRGVVARLILKDYKMIMGKELPFRSLGYNTVEDFIRSIPDVVRLSPGATGELTMFPVANAETQQIARFVASQKKPKLKRKSFAPPMASRRGLKVTGFSTKSRFGISRPRGSFGGGSRSGRSPRASKPFRHGGSYQPLLPPPPRSHNGAGSFWSSQNAYGSQSRFRSDAPHYNQPPTNTFFPKTETFISVPPVTSSSSRWPTNALVGLEIGGAPPRRGRIGSYPNTNVSEGGWSGGRSASAEPRPHAALSSKWKDEYRSATRLTIAEMRNTKGDLKIVCVTGYVCTPYREDKVGMGIKYLLYSDLSPDIHNRADGYGVFPAVMLYFRSSAWDVKEYSDLLRILPGTMLKVYGRPFRQITAKAQKEDPAISVHYYDVVVQSRGVASSEETTSITARPKTPLATGGFVSKTVRDNIYQLLKKYPKGIFAAQLGKTYERVLKTEPPQGIVEMARSLPSVAVLEEVPDHPVLYLKPTTVPESHKAPDSTSSPASSDGGSMASSRSETPPIGFVSSSLKQNIYKLLEECPNGVYATRLEKQFEKKYNKEAPKDIVDIAKTLSLVKIEEDIPGHPVLYLMPSSNQPSKTAPSTHSQSAPSTPLTSPPASQRRDVSFSTTKPALPSTVCFGEDADVFDVTVTYINSVTSFYVQIIGRQHSDKFQKLVDEMHGYLSKNAYSPVSPVKVDQLYGYLWSEEGEELWCRALVRTLTDGEADVMFPDYGNSDLVQVNDLKELPGAYYDLPFQAVQCCLHGLTDSEEATEKFNEMAVGMTCIAQVMDSSGSRVAVELMDSDPAVHETINSILLKAAHPISTLKPQLPEPNDPMVPVTMTDIDMDGVVIIQVQGPGLNQLQQLMTIINETYNKKLSAAHFVKNVSEGSMYCARYSNDKKWYRVEVKKIISPAKVTVKYVDYGNEEDIVNTKLRKPIDDELFSLPFQALRCTLHGLPPDGGTWTDQAVNLLGDYITSDDLNASVVESGKADVPPCIKLYLSQPEGNFFNLNDWLLSQKEVFFESSSEEELPTEDEKVMDLPSPIQVAKTISSENGHKKKSDKNGVQMKSSEGKSLIVSEEVPSPSRSTEIFDASRRSQASSSHSSISGLSSISSLSSSSALSNVGSPMGSNVGVVSIREAISHLSVKESTLKSSSVSTEEQNEKILRVGDKEEVIPELCHDISTQQITLSPNVMSSASSKSSSHFLSPSSKAGPLINVSSSSQESPSQSTSSPSTVFTSSHGTPAAGIVSPHTPSQGTTHTPSPVSVVSPQTPSSPPPSSVSGSDAESVTSPRSGTRLTTSVSLPVKKSSLVMLTWVESPSNFVVQVVSTNVCEDMMTSLNDSLQRSSHPPPSLRPGLVCCAVSTIDNRWYRVVVVGLEVIAAGDNGVETPWVVVEFLDYGGREVVQSSSLKTLPPEFSKLPYQGIKCSLFEILPAGGVGSNWSKEAIDFFSVYENEQYYVVCMASSVGGVCSLVLFDTRSETQVNVNEELINKGYAVKSAK